MHFLFAKSWTNDSLNHMFHHPDGYVLYKTYNVDVYDYLQRQNIDVNLILPRKNESSSFKIINWLLGGFPKTTTFDLYKIPISLGNETVYYKFPEKIDYIIRYSSNNN